ncbi:hypothetical protein TTHERM_001354238 (macronuclear) [Tetrahymena thermophila SB210]|uniref:Uncharacterized protein n=1 Tax=Tetrahymena thermophila (strain SB210) TaxID=312017 RepID=W7XCK4_TETTS|nr:hypothetical protein TTHERM_001354238 [Tetrahymena thermophila SB210]EWS71506.1 hypothetical protein TTHERM_001354238 [Tetrahymena thermophila SB210]|eukprot:XP_012655958.1 hypothetical protein TTHERM_001354238 [Tetrahymena thermophila SB210]
MKKVSKNYQNKLKNVTNQLKNYVNPKLDYCNILNNQLWMKYNSRNENINLIKIAGNNQSYSESNIFQNLLLTYLQRKVKITHQKIYQKRARLMNIYKNITSDEPHTQYLLDSGNTTQFTKSEMHFFVYLLIINKIID